MECETINTLIEKKNVNIDETIIEDKDPEIYEINIGDDEIQMLKFEEFISKQEVDFFSSKMVISTYSFFFSKSVNIEEYVMFTLLSIESL